MESPKILLLKSLYENKVLILDKTLKHFIHKTSLFPKIGLELEFYLTNKDASAIDIKNPIIEKFISDLACLTKDCDLIYKVEREQGVGQIEVKTLYNSDLIKTCDQITKAKSIAENLALERNLTASFVAQPFLEDCGSALQFNISLHNEKDVNLFSKGNDTLLNNSIAALLNFTDEILILLAPNNEDYLRFDKKINQELHKKGKYPAPINLSFGVENRTCAIRIPVQKENDLETIKEKDCANHKKRVEYRIAAANSDPYLVTAAILTILLKGIEEKLSPKELGFEQIYGNAFDEQYNLKLFAKSYEEALQNFNKVFFEL